MYCVYCRKQGDLRVCEGCRQCKADKYAETTSFCHSCGDVLSRLLYTHGACTCLAFNAVKCTVYDCDEWAVCMNYRMWWCKKHIKEIKM